MMQIKTVSGYMTADGIHHSSRGTEEVPDDFFDRVLEWATNPKNNVNPKVIMGAEVRAMFEAELKRG
jgi:hypothetical protein